MIEKATFLLHFRYINECKIFYSLNIKFMRINLNLYMPKPKGQKNTKNKAKHSKLMAKKVNKKKASVAARKEKLQAIVKKAKGE